MTAEDRIRSALSATEWERSPYGHNIYFTLLHCGTECCGTLEMDEENALDRYDPGHVRQVVTRLRELDRQARELIGQYSPNEDVNTLALDDIVLLPDGTLRLGYDAGESPAGNLFLYVSFSPEFERHNELIYETY